jgi:hypothetical protein
MIINGLWVYYSKREHYGATTLSIMTFGIKTLSIMTLSILTFSTMTLSIIAECCYPEYNLY